MKLVNLTDHLPLIEAKIVEDERYLKIDGHKIRGVVDIKIETGMGEVQIVTIKLKAGKVDFVQDGIL